MTNAACHRKKERKHVYVKTKSKSVTPIHKHQIRGLHTKYALQEKKLYFLKT